MLPASNAHAVIVSAARLLAASAKGMAPRVSTTDQWCRPIAAESSVFVHFLFRFSQTKYQLRKKAGAPPRIIHSRAWRGLRDGRASPRQAIAGRAGGRVRRRHAVHGAVPTQFHAH